MADQLQGQVQKQIQQNAEPLLPKGFAPTEVSTPVFADRNPPTVPSTPIQNTNWVRRRMTYVGKTYVDLTQELFLGFGNSLQFALLESRNGRLVANVAQSTLEGYTATIYRNTTTVAMLNVAWTHSIAVYVRGVKVFTSVNSSNTSTAIPLSLIEGNNEINILLYTGSSGQVFDLGVALQLYADGWTTPEIDPPAAPTALVVRPDPNAFDTRDPNINILSWDPNTESNIGGYRIYRRGPFDAGT